MLFRVGSEYFLEHLYDSADAQQRLLGFQSLSVEAGEYLFAGFGLTLELVQTSD